VVWISSKMINIAGIVSIVLFYILILGVGLWAARKKQSGDDSEEEVMLAGRSIGLFVGIFTMTGKCDRACRHQHTVHAVGQFWSVTKAFCLPVQGVENQWHVLEGSGSIVSISFYRTRTGIKK
jgi:hypothetical protein